MQAYMYPMLRDDFELVEAYQVGWPDVNTVLVCHKYVGLSELYRGYKLHQATCTLVERRATAHASAACQVKGASQNVVQTVLLKSQDVRTTSSCAA